MTTTAQAPAPGTEFVKVWHTEYGPHTVTFYVRRCFVRADGSILDGQNEQVSSTQEELGALAVTNGASVDRWGDQEGAQVITAQQIEDKAATPGRAAVPATDDSPEIPAIAPTAAVTHPRFNNLPVYFS